LLQASTKRRIKSHKWNDHSNTSKFFGDLKIHVDAAFEDLALIANNIPEKQLAELFTEEKMEPLIKAIMSPDTSKPKRDIDYERIFFLGTMFLKCSLNITGAVMGNRWAKKMYQEHELPLREILESIHYERKREIKKT
jgi:hypothetical protein